LFHWNGLLDRELQGIDRTRAVSELGLGSPEDFLRQPAFERLAKQALFDLSVVNTLHFGRDRHPDLHHPAGKEWQSYRKTMDRRRTIDSLETNPMGILKQLDERLVKRLIIIELPQVVIPREKFVGPFPG